MQTQTVIPGFRTVPQTGVIYVTTQASKHGFTYGHPDWANLGQGSPETGAIPDAPKRLHQLHISNFSQSYGSVSGSLALRERVAEYYNELYRKDKSSQYTYENVCIAGGGRVALARLAAAMGNINMGHFLPDYTAYEELLGMFKAFTPIPILLQEEEGYRFSETKLRDEVLGRGLRSLLVSNPCNPTGHVMEGELLSSWVRTARELECSIIFDEFYSHYVYNLPEGTTLSAAEYVEDVNEDPIVIVDGLTKNWRYPGWRLGWIVGPKELIKAVSSVGSFMDGGANHPFQGLACDLLEPKVARQETIAIQKYFKKKRDYMISALKEMGIKLRSEPNGSFYLWADLSDLPPPLNDGLTFFEEGLQEKVITVPGIFFDVNPSRRRYVRRYQNYCRISFGPEMENLELGIRAIRRVINKYS